MEKFSVNELPSYVAGARMMLLRLITNGLLSSTPKTHGANEKLTLKERKRFIDSSLVANLLRDGDFLSAFCWRNQLRLRKQLLLSPTARK